MTQPISQFVEEINNPTINAAEGVDTQMRLTGLHNHWLDMNPPVWFAHWQMVGDPLVFARRTRSAFDVAIFQMPSSSE